MIDNQRLLETFLSILRSDSYHPNEDPVIDALRPQRVQRGLLSNRQCKEPRAGRGSVSE